MKKIADHLEAYYLEGWLANPAHWFELLAKLPWQTETLQMYGKQITVPRQVLWVADEGLVYRYSGKDHWPQPWTEALLILREQLSEFANFNSVLGNYYQDGADYMGWHSDNERSLGPKPMIASISLGAERRFVFRQRQTRQKVELKLASGSLLLMQGDSQAAWQHMLPKMRGLTQSRINLTFRVMLGP